MSESIEVSAVFPASPRSIYDAWLSGEGHAAMTGAGATGEAQVGTRFTAWDGYIEGENLELEPYQRIVQSWRTSEFPAAAPDSRLEVTLEEAEGGTKITLKHTEIPVGQSDNYSQGWLDWYFAPMKEYFGRG